MVTKTQAIKKFLAVKAPSDLAEAYSSDMECQVLVAQDGGDRVEGEFKGKAWSAWTDGTQTWKNFRIPLHANTSPEYEDREIRFDLEAHADGIGLTGWDWKNQKSRWVAFDFDAIVGHSDKHQQKLADTVLQSVQEQACKIPWVTVRRSTSGNGLHLYVFLDGIDTENHTEHAALARAILSKMSAITGFDFNSKVDNCFSGDTEILTDVGIKTLKECSGKKVKIRQLTPTGERWVEADIKSFGIQKTYPVHFGTHSTIRATAEHQWLWVDYKNRVNLWNKKYTKELDSHIRLPLSRRTLPEIDWQGFAHGYVFGDGWEVDYHGLQQTEVAIFGESSNLLEKLAPYGRSVGQRKYSGVSVPMVYGLPGHWKNLPENPSAEYAFGFILGLHSADGRIGHKGGLSICQSNYRVLKEIQKLARWIGLRAGEVLLDASDTQYPHAKPKYTLHICTYNMESSMMVRRDYRKKFFKTKRQTTTAIYSENGSQEEEVFCAITPDFANFTLANGVITSNCGSNIWVWHRKFEKVGGKAGPGLKLIKQGEKLLDVPANWRDHIKVASGARKRNKPTFVGDSEVMTFEEFCGQQNNIPLDDEHKSLMNYLDEIGAMHWWDADHHMMVCHTADLKKAHEALAMRGVFETKSTGREHGVDQNCFSGNTEIITDTGIRTLKELSGQSARLYVMTPDGMEWITSEIRSFGLQETIELNFGNYTHCRATADHQWLWQSNKKVNLWNRKYTKELTPTTYLPLAPFDLPEPDMRGYAHGFVYGDGWEVKCRNIETTEVAFFKDDKYLIPCISQFGSFIGEQNFNGVRVPVIRGLPKDWKQLPNLNCSKEYALGFVLGLGSADGNISQSSFKIFQSNLNGLEHVRKLAIYAGLRCGEVRLGQSGSFENSEPTYYLTINTYNLTKSHFLRRDQAKELRARSKDKTTSVSSFGKKRIEEVFCAIVPDYHNFTLANGVITGNCFAFPLRRGGWVVRRHTPGIQEHESWDQDASGWTRCYLNKEPDLKVAARFNGATENEKGGFVFREAEIAAKAARELGAMFDIPALVANRPAILKPHKDGRLVITVERQQGDATEKMRDWTEEKGKWVRILNIKTPAKEEAEVGNYDDLVRHLVSHAQEDCGWVVKSDGQWSIERLEHVKAVLIAMGLNPKDVTAVLGSGVLKKWTLVSKPFAPEYPGDRQWNRNAPQLAFAPSQDIDNLNYPTWNLLLEHIGKGLDQAVAGDIWCQASFIKTGADYLRCWVASLFQNPMTALPYLFLYSEEQETGKSTFHMALDLLMDKGVMRADASLTSQQGFNAELENIVLCVIEETDLRSAKSRQAYDRIKDWVTSNKLLVHKKGKTPYSAPNSTHWIQCSNNISYCPMFPGDTRITMIRVEPLTSEQYIDDDELFQRLTKEAPDFLAAILNLELPQSNNRLGIPVVVTDEKKIAQKAHQNDLESFLDEATFPVPGECIRLGELYERFIEWLDPNQIHEWGKIKMGKSMPLQYPKGRLSSDLGNWYFGNISWSPQKLNESAKKKFILVGQELTFES